MVYLVLSIVDDINSEISLMYGRTTNFLLEFIISPEVPDARTSFVVNESFYSGVHLFKNEFQGITVI